MYVISPDQLQAAKDGIEVRLVQQYHLDKLIQSGPRLSVPEAKLCDVLEYTFATNAILCNEDRFEASYSLAATVNIASEMLYREFPIAKPGNNESNPGRERKRSVTESASPEKFMEHVIDLLTQYRQTRSVEFNDLVELCAMYFIRTDDALNGCYKDGADVILYNGNKYAPQVIKDNFQGVGGQEHVVEVLEEVLDGIRDPGRFHQWGTRPPKGVLMYGPPGNGKTMLARNLSEKVGADFFHVYLPHIVSKWYGDPEKELNEIFTKARERPSIVFFDEIDAIGGMRSGTSDPGHRLLAVLLENLDGIQEFDAPIALAATNAIHLVDAALLRPGRYDHLIEVPNPDVQGRGQIFEMKMREAEERAGRRLFADTDLERLSELSENCSGADLTEIVHRTLRKKVKMNVMATLVTTDNIIAEISRYDPLRRSAPSSGLYRGYSALPASL